MWLMGSRGNKVEQVNYGFPNNWRLWLGLESGLELVVVPVCVGGKARKL